MNLKSLKIFSAGKVFLLPALLLLFAAGAFSQATSTATGKVSDATGPLPNASITIKETKRGTTTNDNGEFSIEVVSGQTLLISHEGFVEQTIKVGNQRAFDVIMQPSGSGTLNDVVVVGYGVKRKTSVTAAVSTLKGTEVASLPISNLTNGLGGRVSGVIVKQGSGEPGRDASSIFIRGISSTGATQPLVIVDGIPRSFQQLDPNSIESFSILKDAAAVAPYGVAGANGVILVTTKKGKAGAPTLTYNGYVGFQNPVELPKFVNSFEYATLRNAAAKNEGVALPYTDEELRKFKDGSDPDAYPTHANIWGDITNRNAILTNHNIEVSGGAEKIKYYAGLGYQFQEGMWPATNSRRFNLSLSLDAQVTKTTNVSFKINGIQNNDKYPAVSTGRIFELIGYLHPLYGPLRFSNGMPGTFLTGSLFNSGYQKVENTTLYSQLSIEQSIPFIPGLKAKGTIAYDPSYLSNKLWTLPVHKASLDKSTTPYTINDGIWGQTKPSLSQSIDHARQFTYQAGLTYDRDFGRHGISVLGLFEAKSNALASLAATRRNFNLEIDELNMGSSSQADMSTGGASTLARQMGVVYRVAYDFDKKYLIEASGRYDGSYYFAPENRFGFFPAFSAGWRLSEEKFMKNQFSWLDNLKIRASYGEVGALAGSPFQYMNTYSVLGTNYSLGGNAVQGITARAEPNPNITWERAKKTDIGLEVNLWKGLFNFEIDYFHEKRSNMLMNPDVIVPSEYGIGLSQVNAGIMENRGFDFSASSIYNVTKDLQVSLGATMTYAKNKLIQVFEGPTTFNNPNRKITGRPLGTQFGYESLGYFQASDFDQTGALVKGIATQPWGAVQPGDIRYKDQNGDGKINDDDITKIGEPVAAPRIIYGFSPAIRYKGIGLDLLFQGAARASWYYHPSAVMPFWETMLPYQQNFDYWTPQNTNAAYPRLTSQPTVNNSQTSSFWVGDASYLRLKSATLSYTIPAGIMQKVKIQNARIFLSGQNIFTWTKLVNYDPEIGQNNSWIPNGSWGYPNQKAISVGANVTF
jgi:TonB-linked SusC/RagA family outer membrane protein